MSDAAAGQAEELGVAELVTVSDPVPRRELIARMMAADALLLPLDGSDPGQLPMKLFEHVGARRPIIAFGRPGDLTARLVRDNGLGVVAEGDDELKLLLRDLVEGCDGLPRAGPEVRERFTWDASVATLAALVEEAAQAPPARTSWRLRR